MRVTLPYGTRPYPIDLTGHAVDLLKCASLPAPAPVADLLAAALPASFPVPAGGRVTVILSDGTRSEPRADFLRAIRRRLPPSTAVTVAIATGTHGPASLDDLHLPADLLTDTMLINHDGHRLAPPDLVDLGTTPRGTPIRVHRCVIDADLVIATGCIRPHYFAGFGAGAKAIFPGLGEATAIRINHRLKLERDARAGIVDGNPCREDIEDAVRAVARRTPIYLVNGVCDPDDRIQHVVVGDVFDAFREGVAQARPWFEVRAAPAPIVIASDALPVTASLYQAAKLAAAAAPLVAENGTLILAAECPDGIGPLETVNEAIFRIGILPRLAPGVRLVLVSSLGEAQTATTLLTYRPTIEAAVAEAIANGSTATSPPPRAATIRVLVLPHASKVIATPV